MDVVQSSRKLLSDMIEQAGSQMKILLMDAETTPIVSCAFAQSEVMQKEVYIFDKLENKHTSESMKNLKCIVFVRPTNINIDILMEELQKPRFSQYYLYFSHVINKIDVKRLAESDKNELVREIQEVFLDGIPLRKDLFSLNINSVFDRSLNYDAHLEERMKNGIVALLLQLRVNSVVRYQKDSSICRNIANEVSQFIRRENGLFENSKEHATVICVERSVDIVTPLLNQWTYEAMIHELLTLSNNRCICNSQSIVLSELHDDFFSKNIIANFGEIGQNIKTLISDFQEKKHINKNLESIQDMKKFVEDYPQFKKISGTVSKHVSLVGELSNLVQKYNLLEISEVEQSIISEGNHNKCLERILELIKDPRTRELDAIRLISLYAIRFENVSGNQLQTLMSNYKFEKTKLKKLVQNLLRYGGISKKPNDLFGGQSTIDITKRFIKGLKGVENIYTQHSPYLKNVIDGFNRGKLEDFPLLQPGREKTDNLIIFVVGGVTYEEASAVRYLNSRRKSGLGGPSIVLASNCVHNTNTFLEEFMAP